MKKFTFLFSIIILGFAAIAQTPQAINYQAVARAVDGEPIINQEISVKISILSQSTSGDVVYSELHDVTTNSMGLFNLEIGNPGEVLSGVFDEITWGTDNYFMKLEMDENGGFNFVHIGTSQLLSVPYALYSENTANPEDADADPQNELQTLEKQGNLITLSHDGGSFINGIVSYTQAEIDDLEPFNGLTVHNSTTNCINYYYLSSWYAACGDCTPMPTQANAGNDTIVADINTSITLYANTPTSGEGFWTILSGDGGAFADPANPETLFTGQESSTYLLQWEIFTTCDKTYDDVLVAFYSGGCGQPFTDTRDSMEYQTVLIGNQCWMAQNLAYLPSVSPPSIGSTSDPHYYVYNYYGSSVAEAQVADFYDLYGVLYNWPASLTACPTNWHLPTDLDWAELIDYLGGIDVAGGKMKSTRTEPDMDPFWYSPNTGATNSSGFTGLGGGINISIPEYLFFDIRSYGSFWSSTGGSTTKAWIRILKNYSADVQRHDQDKQFGLSVRCLRDE